MTSIKEQAFGRCESLTNIMIDAQNESLSSSAGIVFSKDGKELVCYPAASGEYTVPNTVKHIANGAFIRCKVSRITIPEGIESVGERAFAHCVSLENVKIAKSVESIGAEAFSECNNLQSVEILSNIESIENRTFYGCIKLESVKIPSSVKYIKDEAFCTCRALGSIELPSNLVSIGDSVFLNCSSLSNIEIPNSVETMGIYVFSGCSNLKTATLPNTIKAIKEHTFGSCLNLSTIVIPKSVESIRESAFYNCQKLSTIYIQGDRTEEKKQLEMQSSSFRPVADNAIVYFQSSNIEVPSLLNVGLEEEQFKQPYSISCIAEDGSKTIVKEVYADNKQSYTVQAGDVPSSEEIKGQWMDEFYNEKQGICWVEGSTIENISENIELVLIPLENYTVENTVKTVDAANVLPEGWQWSEEDEGKALLPAQSVTANAEYVGANGDFYLLKSRPVTITRTACTEDSTILFTGEHDQLPTCTEGGVGHTECKYCHDVMNANISVPSTGHQHKEVRDQKAATCKEEGYEGTTYCVDCETPVVSGNFIPKLATHTWNQGEVTKAATATEKGIKTYTCSVCKLTKMEEIPAFGGATGTGGSEDKPSQGGSTGGSEEKPSQGGSTGGNKTPEMDGPGSALQGLAAFEKELSSTNTDKKNVVGSCFAAFQLKATGKNKSIKLTWKKVKGADGYIIYGSPCGSALKKIKTIKGADKVNYIQKKLKKGSYYKYIVVAYKGIDGKQSIVGKSTTAFGVTNGGKYGNATKISVKPTKLTMKKGKKEKLKVSLVVPKDKKYKTYISKVRYESSNSAVATVNKKGEVTAKKKGTAYIYVYTQNGVYKKVKVTVR